MELILLRVDFNPWKLNRERSCSVDHGSGYRPFTAQWGTAAVYHLNWIIYIYTHTHNENTTSIEDLLNSFNDLTPNLKFTLEKEVERKINFLDTTIHRESNNLSIEIYRKPTYTDSIIPNDSCHPKEHKLAAIRYLYNRVNNYQLPPDKTQKEDNTVNST
jgi:hypothetical protein